MSTSPLSFKPFNKETAEGIRPWFNDPDTKKWLGDSSWVDMELKQQSESIGTEFRGAKTIARYGWVVYDDDKAIGYIDGGISNRYVKYGGEVNGKPVYLEVEDKLTSAISYAICPDERRKGYASQLINQLLTRPELEQVEIFLAGVEPENIGSIKALEKAGFKSDHKPDFEDMYYFFLRR